MNVIQLTRYRNETRVDSRLLAEQLKTNHASTIKLIRKYLTDFQEIGPIGFEIQKGKSLPQGGFAKATEYALLNEDQAYLLLTYSRNTKKVRALKVNLVMAFREARYGSACQVLAARKEEASKCGRGLAHWRYNKPVVYERVAYLREQLKLPIDLEGA